MLCAFATLTLEFFGCAREQASVALRFTTRPARSPRIFKSDRLYMRLLAAALAFLQKHGEFLNTMAADRRDDPELGKMSADCIDYRSLLADEQVPGSV
jgi:hypothetical protein